jgi:hypothetical protein
MNMEDMYRWWNDAALSNPMKAILSNEIALGQREVLPDRSRVA